MRHYGFVPHPALQFLPRLFAYNPMADSWRGNLDLMRVRRASVGTIDPRGEWEIVLLHGWHSLYAPMMGLENALRERVPNARLWRVSYDSHWKVFPRSAREVAARLRAAGVQPERTLLVGYSMGGVVARSMVAQGFDARAVICLCSPHLGPALHIPFADAGSYSLAYSSGYLKQLNRNERDIARRGDYFFQSITFRDATGECRHDRIVSQRSASGRGLVGIVHRANTHLEYEGVVAGPLPHVQGMNPNCVPKALEFAVERLS